MNHYEFDEMHPFYKNPNTKVKLFHGICTSRNGLAVVLKQHSFDPSPDCDQSISQALNAARAQTQVQHPHTCEVLDVQFQRAGEMFLVYHVLEFLESSLGQEIGKRVKENRHFTEVELRVFLQQTSSALAYAHSKASPT